VECLFSDTVRASYMTSQDSLTREPLEVRNNENMLPNFFDLIAAKFNDTEYKPFSSVYPSLRSDFGVEILLEKGECT